MAVGAVGNGPPFSKARWARLRVHGAGRVHGLFGPGDRPHGVGALKSGRPAGRPTRRTSFLGHPGRSCLSRGGLRSVGGGFSPTLGVLGPETGDIEFQQHRVMDQAIDGGGRRHLIPKDPIPLREDQIAGDAD